VRDDAARMRALTTTELERFDHVPGTDALRARIALVPLLQPGTAGMTLGRLILLRRDHVSDEELLAHELVHVRQWRERGVVGFLRRYLTDYARGLGRLRSHRRAYLAIPAEQEARRLAAEWAARRASP
jgi:hypothetical protein